MTGLLGLALTTQDAYEVLLPEGWSQFDAVRNLAELAALPAGNGKRILVLDLSVLFTLDTSSAATADGARIIARTNGGAGRWVLFSPSFDRLWAARAAQDLKVYGFTSVQARDTPAAAPIVVTLPNIGPVDGHTRAISSLCFQLAGLGSSSGDLVVGFTDTNASPASGQSIARIAAASLTATGSPSPSYSFAITTPTAVSTIGIQAMGFSKFGNLWLGTKRSASAPGGLLRYSNSQYLTANIPALNPRSFSQPGSLNSVDDLCFDASDNIWFCNAFAGTVNMLSLSQQANIFGDNALVPAVSLAIGAYTGCAIDAAGNLWCTTTGYADMFALANIQSSGAPTPTRRIATGTPLGQSPRPRFAVDGSLWVSASAGVYGYPATDILQTGAPAPSAILTGAGALTAASALSFNPASFA